MASREYQFSITPIGAAYVEALPDGKKASAIERDFKKNARCPTSAIFNAEQVVEFYKQRGLKVTAIPHGVKSRSASRPSPTH